MIINKIFSISILILLSPVLLIISLKIIIQDGRPVIFKQKRIGKDNKEFDIYKFRTMKLDTPNKETDTLVNPKKYLIRSGAFLRKYSLDEIPQLFNILKNEMNIIGPRPALYNQTKLIEDRTKLGIQSIKPGITGWAQVNGRDEISMSKKIELDYYFLNNKSIILNIKILFLTIFKVVRSTNIKS